MAQNPHPLLTIREGDEVLKTYYENDVLMGLDLTRAPDYGMVYLVRTKTIHYTFGDSIYENYYDEAAAVVRSMMVVGAVPRHEYDEHREKYAYAFKQPVVQNV